MTNVLTRIRLKSGSPLPEFRIWFAIPQNVESIKELKTLIHKSVIFLKKSDFQPSHLMLELEDYELPDESPIGLLRESDVIFSNISKPLIPPGMGKPSTHSRNRRRKIKRWKQKTQNIIQDGNEDQQGYNSHEAVKESIIHDHLPFFPPHTNTLQQCVPSKARDNRDSLPHPLANFIPPSERHDLPSNIFVTSIDVEDMNYWKDHSACEENFQLEEIPYGTNFDWDTIDGSWNTYPKVTSSTLISKGSILGWRAFGLNPSTLTPDVSLLHLGKVLEIDSNGIHIVILSRGMASFGGVILEEGSEEEIIRKREDIILENWRLIDRS
ncbi:hypothetical protein Clacol_002017 [Clathrus columnatus]|uniref:Coilin n=1 Tax=Clathrus columnatus TaxID=1419009 RepID=A0AAV5A2Y8_9AGAM|nr:hypothetical protein Clacol_002017 [Clathrus columnatus]